jgi:hypothetical protein
MSVNLRISPLAVKTRLVVAIAIILLMANAGLWAQTTISSGSIVGL